MLALAGKNAETKTLFLFCTSSHKVFFFFLNQFMLYYVAFTTVLYHDGDDTSIRWLLNQLPTVNIDLTPGLGRKHRWSPTQIASTLDVA